MPLVRIFRHGHLHRPFLQDRWVGLPGKDETLIFTSTSHSSHCVDQMRIPITVSRRSRMCPKRLTTSDLYLTSFMVVVISEFVFCCLYVFCFTIYTKKCNLKWKYFPFTSVYTFRSCPSFSIYVFFTRRRLTQMSAHNITFRCIFRVCFNFSFLNKGDLQLPFSRHSTYISNQNFCGRWSSSSTAPETFPTQWWRRASGTFTTVSICAALTISFFFVCQLAYQ